MRKTWAPVGRTPILRHRYRRDKISVISAVTISGVRHWIGLYFRLHRENINGERVVEFLRHLLRHLRGHVVLLWDGGTIHRKAVVQDYLLRNRRLHTYRFPAYAPELNPDEHVWTQSKCTLANSAPNTIDELECGVGRELFRLQHSPNLLWSCIDVAELSWP